MLLYSIDCYFLWKYFLRRFDYPIIVCCYFCLDGCVCSTMSISFFSFFRWRPGCMCTYSEQITNLKDYIYGSLLRLFYFNRVTIMYYQREICYC